MKYSIILNAYDTDRAQRHQTIACVAAITKFTDKPYELIIVDNEPFMEIRDDYKVFDIAQYIAVVPKETAYESYNIGAKKATTDYFFFIQSDVFVHDRTFDKLFAYFDRFDMVFPQQHEISREDMLQLRETPDGQDTHIGQRDAGLIGIKREAFEKVGGWDGRFRNLLGEKDFFDRCDNAGITWTDRTNAFVTHIKAGNNLRKEPGLYNEEMDHDAKLIQGKL